jgi:osmoprotectant transport system permease protein
MDERVQGALRLLPDYLGQHVILSAASLLLGLAVSAPLVVLARRNARVRWPVLTLVGVIQTVPSIALLALFYPLLLALSSVSQEIFGHGFAALGFLPSLLALTLYSMLPIVRNSVTGLLNVDPAVMEAARGVGMTPRQSLFRVELPLAMPVIMAGIRTSAVWVIGTATLSTPVGQTSLGNYIFSGLQIENWVSVLFGCVSAVALALITDQLLALVEHGVAARRPGRAWLGLGLLVAGIAVAVAPSISGTKAAYVVGAKSFSEQYILADLLSDRIRRSGSTAVKRIGLGSVIAFKALANDEIDAYVDYSGTLWANILKRTDSPPRAQMLEELTRVLKEKYGVTLLGALGFENAYALAMRGDEARALNVHSIADLAARSGEMKLGADYEFLARPEWAALRSSYGLAFRERRQYQSTFMYRAVASGEVDVISAFSSDGRIAAYDLTVLEDTKQVILPYDAIVLLAPGRANDQRLRRALMPLIGAVPIEQMREANQMVDREENKLTPAQAAQWLATKAGLN